MNGKEEILNSIRQRSVEKIEMPDLSKFGSSLNDNEEKFIHVSQLVGGKVILLNKDNKSLQAIIRELYPEVTTIVSNLYIEDLTTTSPNEYTDPHQLNNTDIAIIEGQFGVAENGAIWITNNMKHRAIYFIAENLIILLNRNSLVSTMHEAYNLIEEEDYAFGVFISGPSKTADIEQALVIGAHGARSVTVLLI